MYVGLFAIPDQLAEMGLVVKSVRVGVGARG
jgi:hypothetical protein